jgi:hypothetical protein
MRPIVLLRGALLVLLVWGGPCFAQLSGDPQALGAFAERAGLRDVKGFVETVQILRDTGHLPPRYVTKDEARARAGGAAGCAMCGPVMSSAAICSAISAVNCPTAGGFIMRPISTPAAVRAARNG